MHVENTPATQMQANPNEPRKLVSKPSVDWICSNLIYAFSVVVVVSNRVYFSLLLRAEIKKKQVRPKEILSMAKRGEHARHQHKNQHHRVRYIIPSKSDRV